MFPILIELQLPGATVPIQTYGVAMFVALLAGLAVARRGARRLALDPDHLLLGFILLMPGILIAAKLIPLALAGDLGSLTSRIGASIAAAERPAVAATGWIVSLLMPGGSTLGAALGGGLGLLAYVRWFRLPMGDVLDALAPALALGLPLMRTGCLAAGCCFGAAASVPWSVVYTHPLVGAAGGPPLGVPLHPAPAYEAIGALLLGVLLWRQLGRRRASGEVFAAFVAGYGLLRLLLAPLRGDAPLLPGALAWAAVSSAGIAVLLWLRPLTRPADEAI